MVTIALAKRYTKKLKISGIRILRGKKKTRKVLLILQQIDDGFGTKM